VAEQPAFNRSRQGPSPWGSTVGLVSSVAWVLVAHQERVRIPYLTRGSDRMAMFLPSKQAMGVRFPPTVPACGVAAT